jgi:hypothetical protein
LATELACTGAEMGSVPIVQETELATEMACTGAEIGSVPIVQETELATELACTGAENLTSTGMRSPDPPAGNESVYRLRYSGRI